ncbi:hypothetical protein [Legionella tunisiensis]|uniref:hypothetical protein n=1 Tax=Legionella tunisiensis TaxID=1034944 RepID=UPI00030A6D6B|nr:hypothetical protein [Legionella tunisiensis]
MASALELAFSYFRRTQPVSTPLPTLGVNNQLNKLQKDSEQYFTIGVNAQATDGILAVQVVHAFDPDNESHMRFMNDCTALLQQKSKALKELDQTIMGSVLVGVVASSLSFLPLVGYLSWAGWGSAIYHLSQRSLAYTEYQEALKLSVACCNWSLGPQEGRIATKDVLQNNPGIRNMMVTLYPVLTRIQITHFIANDIESAYVAELNKYESSYKIPNLTTFAPSRDAPPSRDENIALSKKGAEFNRCVYGFNKGSAMDFVDAFVSFLPDLYNAACYGCRQVQRKWQEYNAPSVEQRSTQL